MATIVGGIATSHTPTIGFALDANKQNDPVWAPIFKGYEPVSSGSPRRSPTSCSTSTTTTSPRSSSITTRSSRSASVSGTGRRMRAAARASSRTSRATRGSRGTSPPASSPTSSTCPIFRPRAWTTAASRRCRCCGRTRTALARRDRAAAGGRARVPDPVREALLQARARRCARRSRAIPEDIKVAIVGTGGLSHQVHGERAGFNNTPWDMEFLELPREGSGEAHEDHDRRVRRGAAASKAPRSSCG